MLIILESVGSLFDTSSMCIHPQLEDGSYDKEFSISIEDDEVAADWWDGLSVEDYDTVTCCI